VADDVFVHALPLYHSAQMHVFLLPALAQGARSIIVPGPVPEQLFDLFETRGITSFFAAPTVWVAIANHPEFAQRDLTSLTKGYYGASIMPGPILTRLQEALPGMGFYNAFGQSEMGPLCTVLRPEEHADRPGSAGRPSLFVETRVVDASGNDVEPGQQGEILYRSPQLCEGYWNKPEATEEAFRGGWFHSGDLVVQDEQGFIEVVDRVKDVINSGGVLVASRQVEDAIFELEEVAEVAVVGMPDDKWIEAITAFVVSKGAVDEETIVAHVRSRLAPFKVPKAVHFVDELPKNTSGKILKRQLRG
jgi:fatty-acyl-CoA synthase